MTTLKVGGDVISLELYQFQGTDNEFMTDGHRLQYVKCRIKTQFSLGL